MTSVPCTHHGPGPPRAGRASGPRPGRARTCAAGVMCGLGTSAQATGRMRYPRPAAGPGESMSGAEGLARHGPVAGLPGRRGLHADGAAGVEHGHFLGLHGLRARSWARTRTWFLPAWCGPRRVQRKRSGVNPARAGSPRGVSALLPGVNRPGQRPGTTRPAPCQEAGLRLDIESLTKPPEPRTAHGKTPPTPRPPARASCPRGSPGSPRIGQLLEVHARRGPDHRAGASGLVLPRGVQHLPVLHRPTPCSWPSSRPRTCPTPTSAGPSPCSSWARPFPRSSTAST